MDLLHTLLTENQDVNWSDVSDEHKDDIEMYIDTIHELDPEPLEGKETDTYLTSQTKQLLQGLPTCYPLKRMFEHPKLHKEYKHVLIKDDGKYHFCFNIDTFAQFMYTWDGTQFVYVEDGQDDDAPWYDKFTTYNKVEDEDALYHTYDSKGEQLVWQRLPACTNSKDNLITEKEMQMEIDTEPESTGKPHPHSLHNMR